MTGEEIEAFLKTLMNGHRKEIPVELFSRELLRTIESSRSRKQFCKVFELLAGGPVKRISVERLRESMKDLGERETGDAALTLIRSAQSHPGRHEDQRRGDRAHVRACRLRRGWDAECQRLL